jgi:hypothetical protein
MAENSQASGVLEHGRQIFASQGFAHEVDGLGHRFKSALIALVARCNLDS